MDRWEEINFSLIFPSSTSLVFKRYNEMITQASQLIMSRTNSDRENGFLLDNLETNKLPCTDK